MSEQNMTFPLPFVERIASERDGFPHTIEFGIDADNHLGVKTDSGDLTNFFDLIKDQMIEYMKDEMIDSMYPVGSVYITIGGLPSWLKANGRTWAKIDSGRCLMSSGAHPDGTYTAGELVKAGIPNIKGRVGRWDTFPTWGASTDAFNCFVSGSAGGIKSGSSDSVWYADMNAKNGQFGKDDVKQTGEAIVYGESNTVTPQSYIVDIWKRVS